MERDKEKIYDRLKSFVWQTEVKKKDRSLHGKNQYKWVIIGKTRCFVTIGLSIIDLRVGAQQRTAHAAYTLGGNGEMRGRTQGGAG